jgi:hypothetical protein
LPTDKVKGSEQHSHDHAGPIGRCSPEKGGDRRTSASQTRLFVTDFTFCAFMAAPKKHPNGRQRKLEFRLFAELGMSRRKLLQNVTTGD